MVRSGALHPLGAVGDAAAYPTHTISMTKLEAAGNDFLVVLDDSRGEDVSLTPAQVRALCDRHRGVGADGLIVGRLVAPRARAAAGARADGSPEAGPLGARADGSPEAGPLGAAPADLEMVLHNADGSEAEMSGNGIRCLVHAAVLAGLVVGGDVRVSTGAGLRTVFYEPGAEPGDEPGAEPGAEPGDEPGAGGGAWARVSMGPVRLGREVESVLPGTRARLADVGNPHLVVIGDVVLEAVDLEALGAASAQVAGRPVNLEVVRPGRGGADLELRVLERGVGETLACGTGSCATAAVARAFGMVGSVVQVDNPGGRLEVRLGDAADAGDGDGDAGFDWAELGGPVRKVADVEVETSFFASSRFLASSSADA